MADSGGPVRGGMAGAGVDAGAEPGSGGEDAVRLALPAGAGSVPGGPASHASASGEAVAGDVGSAEGGVLFAASRPGPVVRVGLHAPVGSGSDHRWSVVRSHGVPLRADAFELGARDGLLHRELRESVGRIPERGVDAGRGSGASSQRQLERGGEQPVERGGVHESLRGVDASLRRRPGADRSSPGSRERRRGAEPSPLQAGDRPAADASGRARLFEPGGVRVVPVGADASTQRRSGRSGGRGRGGASRSSGSSSGGVQDGDGAGGQGEPDPRGRQRLLGSEPVDRRAGRGSVARRTSGGVARRSSDGASAEVAGPIQAPGELSARDRLAGPQAGRVRTIPLSRGPVSDEPVPDGVRRAALAQERGLGGSGIPADPRVGREGERVGGGRRVADSDRVGRADRGVVGGATDGECRRHVIALGSGGRVAGVVGAGRVVRIEGAVGWNPI